MRLVMATPRMHPCILGIADTMRYPAAEEAFLRESGLVPTLFAPGSRHHKGGDRHPSTRESERTLALIRGSVPSRNTRELIEKDFKMSNATRAGWRNYIREALAEMREQPPMGGVGEVVQIEVAS
ncbi:hypothetical protein MTO96_029773 [Rhipicephalus appendiculatus]